MPLDSGSSETRIEESIFDGPSALRRSAGDLSGTKARILLKLLLENGYGKDDVLSFVERHFC